MIEEKDLKDGCLYDVIDRSGDTYPSAEWSEAHRVFILRWTRRDGEEIEKRLPIEDVAYVSEFEDLPW